MRAGAKDDGEAGRQRRGKGHRHTRRGDDDEGKVGRIEMRAMVRPRALEPRMRARTAAGGEGGW